MRVLGAFLLSIFLTAHSFAADISFRVFASPFGDKIAHLELSGPIEKGDYQDYLETYEFALKKNDFVNSISLNSNGGLVSEALLIGKHVRKNRMNTSVNKDNECHSSCALIFLSGLGRSSNGNVGVHRSYFERGTDLSFDELEETLGKSYERISSYLRDMRVPERIIEDFITTSSTEIKLIYDVPNDRLYDEYLISKCGKAPEFPARCKTPDLLNLNSAKVEKHRACVEKFDLKIDAYISANKKYRNCTYPFVKQLQQSVQKK